MSAAPIPASRVARAESAFKDAERRARETETATAMRYAVEHGESRVQAQARRMAIVTPWPSLVSAVGWFKREWQAALPHAMHTHAIEPGDAWGGPALTERWRSYLMGRVGTGDEPEPIRSAMRAMSRSDNRYERTAAAFLFALACLDFDTTRAGLAIDGHCLCEPERHPVTGEWLIPHAAWATCSVRILPLAPEYAPYYAEQAIERLRQLVVRAERRGPRPLPEPDWKRRAGLSESQANAEAG